MKEILNHISIATEIDADLTHFISDPDFPQYGYGIFQASVLARALSMSTITVIELGVAGGNGLISMEEFARRISPRTSVDIRIVGFDLGSGMPSPVDYRDLPYIWRQGFFKMDQELLRSSLSSSELRLGDVRVSGREFMDEKPPAIGFISFDLDYYSSTSNAMNQLLSGNSERYLPRVLCYFDDTVGSNEEFHSEYTGELLAIREFNNQSMERKLSKINGLRYKVGKFDGPWVEGMYVLHIFDHPRYGEYVFSKNDRQFPLILNES